MKNLDNKTKLAIGSLLIGALAGATIGVLFAPNKGKKSRKNIANSVKKTSGKIKKEILQEGKYLKNKAIKFENRMEDKVNQATTSFKDKANELLHGATDHQMVKK